MSDDWKQKFGQSVRIWSQLEKGLGSVEIVARYGLGCAGRVVSGWVLVRGVRGGPGCLNRFSASISGASAGVRLPSGGAAA
jgi:hypothetical protein